MRQKNDRKNGIPAGAGLKASDNERVKSLLDSRIISVFTENKVFNSNLLELDALTFIKLFGKGITYKTKKRDKLPYNLQNSPLANASDIRRKANSKEFKKTLRSLHISYQNTIDRIFILITKLHLSRQKHMIPYYLNMVLNELKEKHNTSVTRDGRNIIDHSDNIYATEKLLKLFS